MKELDRTRKRAKNAGDWLKRQQDEELMRRDREKERLKKQKYRMRISKKEKKAEPVTSAKKNTLCRQKRKFEKQIETLQEELNQLKKKANKITPKRLKEELNLVNRNLWSYLSPSTNQKTKKKLVESSPRGIGHMFHSGLGVNIHQSSSIGTETLQQKAIKAFMERDNVSRVSPYMKTVTSRNGDNVPTRYRMLSLMTLYIKFCSENGSTCSFSSFARNIPSNIK